MPAPQPAQLETQFDNELRPLVPHISEYFGPWAIWDQSFRGMFQHYRSIDVRAHINEHRAETSDGDQPKPLAASFSRIGGGADSTQQIAFIALTGPLMKFKSSMAAGTSTIQVRRQIREALRDPGIGAICLHFDTPGGTFSGTADLGVDIRNAAAQKPTLAFVSDLCASAGMWLAAQAGEVVSTKTSLVGSIGTFLVVEDSAGAAEAAGIKVHVLRAGDFKGRTVEGAPVDAEALTEMQRIVTGINEHFLEAVADGRRLKIATVREIADGRVHMATEAKKLGLIDRIGTLDEELSRLNQQIQRNGKARTMTDIRPQTEQQPPAPQQTATPPAPETPPAPVAAVAPPQPLAATLEQLEAACPGADAAFLVGQMKAGATVDAATRNFITAQQQQIAALQSQPPATTAQATPAPAAQPPGVEPLKTSDRQNPANGKSAREQMNEYVREKTAKGMRASVAMQMFNREFPTVRAMVIEECNS